MTSTKPVFALDQATVSILIDSDCLRSANELRAAFVLWPAIGPRLEVWCTQLLGTEASAESPRSLQLLFPRSN